MMPHAIRRVVVARSARIAAGLAVMLSGAALLATAGSPALAAWIARGLPGIQPAVLSTLLGATWIVGICVYAIARARVEHRFAVAMSRYVLPGSDLDHDIERLDHEHPDEAAKQMAHGLEVRSAALPVIAAAFVLPATAIYTMHAIQTRGWPVISEFEASLAMHAHALIAIAMAGVVAGIVTTRRAARLPIVAPIAGPIAVIAAGIAAAATARHAMTAAWAGLALALIATTIGLVARRLRIERALIATDDPAAGSELFTLRGFVRQLRSVASDVRTSITHVRRRVIPIVALFAAILGTAAYQHSRHTEVAIATAVVHHTAPNVTANALGPSYQLVRTKDGKLQLDFDLDGTTPFVVPALAELDTLPKNWHAQVTLELVSTPPGALVIDTLGLPPRTLDFNAPTTELDADVCDDTALTLSMSIQAPQAPPGRHHVTIYVTPRLGVAHCS